PYMVIVGEKEAENNELSVRKQGEGDKGTYSINDFAQLIVDEVNNMTNKFLA
ncbi:MAG: hypothetical protein KA298_03200, partial [Paludibacteraceae bacterium]|nr:hypothetical protein [Paludibacteraceae bacterium]